MAEIRSLFLKYAPQLWDVFKLKSLLTLVVENVFFEMRTGAYDSPIAGTIKLSLQSDNEGAFDLFSPA